MMAQQQQLYANVTQRNGVSYASYGADSDFPLPPPEVLPRGEEYPPPPAPASPVSSAYSELRRANVPHQPPQQQAPSRVPPQHHLGAGGYGGGAGYAPGSHASTGYESLYEPISPRPASQMSTRSGGYGPASVYAGSGSGPYTSGRPQAADAGDAKEAEVDALTSLLVQSMESSGDPEFFGICARCGGKVVGEGSGCSAMDQVFHIRCFDCIVCHLQLQGKTFYAVDCKPYCEDCYLNTLEKCCVCTKPILERILRATGKPYHPGCFTCVVCHKALDGIQFTVDAANQIHCIEDFHKKFAPRCSVCQEPIMPEPGLNETVRVVALDRSFHVNCYKCEDCGLLLSSEAEGRGCYPLDGHVLCKSCNARRVQELSSTLSSNI